MSTQTVIPTTANGLSQYVANKDNVDTIIENTVAGLDLNSITEFRNDRFSVDETRDIFSTMDTFLKDTYGIDSSDLLIHLTMIVKRGFTLTTSPNVRFTAHGYIQYSLKGKVYKLIDNVVFPFIISKYKTQTTPNPLRKLFCTLEVLHIGLSRVAPELYEGRRFTLLGTPHGKAYLGADFLSGSLHQYSEHDRAIILRSSEVALSATSKSKENNELVSLRELGKSNFI